MIDYTLPESRNKFIGLDYFIRMALAVWLLMMVLMTVPVMWL